MLELPSCTAIALMKLSVTVEGALLVRHTGWGARASSVTQSDDPPARRRAGLFGSSMNGEVKLVLRVDCGSHWPSSFESRMPAQMRAAGWPPTERCSERYW